jgi:hypothetical protein
MDGGVREILDAAGMVEVEVGHHDMAHVRGGEAERAHLRDGGFLGTELDVVELEEELRQPAVRMIDVAGAEAGIDQDQPSIAFDQQAMAHEVSQRTVAGAVEQSAAGRAAGSAVKMMNAHRPAPQ